MLLPLSFVGWNKNTKQDAFDVEFPDNATTDQKAILVGSTILINAVFFESSNNNNAAS